MRQAAAPTITASIGRLLDTVDRHPSTLPDSPVNDLVAGAMLLMRTPDNQHLWAAGSQNGKGVVATSSDAGRTWEILGGGALPDTGGLWKVSVVSNCALRR
jgi:hypothetical protein